MAASIPIVIAATATTPAAEPRSPDLRILVLKNNYHKTLEAATRAATPPPVLPRGFRIYTKK